MIHKDFYELMLINVNLLNEKVIVVIILIMIKFMNIYVNLIVIRHNYYCLLDNYN